MTEAGSVTIRNRERLERRKKHVRKVLLRNPIRPRLVVYRSNKHTYAALVDDVARRTITSCSTRSPAVRERIAGGAGKLAPARAVGERIAELASRHGITAVSFDRNGRKYHGRVKAVAEGARAGGLKF